MPTYIQGSWPPNKGCPVAVQIAWVRSGENTARLVFLLLFIVLVFILCRFYFRISRAFAIQQCASMSFNVDHSYTFPEREEKKAREAKKEKKKEETLAQSLTPFCTYFWLNFYIVQCSA